MMLVVDISVCVNRVNHLFYILNTLAPPQILGDVSECTSYHFCSQPHSSVDPSSDDDTFVISVEYYGANATIEWQYKGQTINFDEQVYNWQTVTSGLYHKTVGTCV